MSEQMLFESVDLARDRLNALLARLVHENAAGGTAEFVRTLSELQGVLVQLQARYGLLRDVLDRTSDMVFAKHADGRYAMMNPRGAELLGRSLAEVLGQDDRALFGPEDGARLMAIDSEVMLSGQPRVHEQACDVGGKRAILLVTTTHWRDADRSVRGVIGIAQEVTERRRDEREASTKRGRLRKLATENVLSEERLRRMLAAELHNGLGQDIALAKMKLSRLRDGVGVELREPLSGIEQLVEQADRSLRSITFQISPPSLHDLGLVAALEWLSEDMLHKYGLSVDVEDAGAPAVKDERVRVILFRAVRELLVNVATHAGVRHATVRLDDAAGDVRIHVQDAGIGFDVSDAELRGYGLFGIDEQLKYVEGNLQVVSSRDAGTSVTLTAPVQPAPAPAH